MQLPIGRAERYIVIQDAPKNKQAYSCKKRALFVLSCTGVILVLYGFSFQLASVDVFDSVVLSINQMQFFDPKPIENHLVLAWTTHFGADLARILTNAMSNCPLNCTFTTDRSKLSEAEAVIFHMRNVDRKSLPKARKPEQYFVFFLMEAPPQTGNRIKQLPDNYFNITMTYRRDSDVLRPYGALEKIGDLALENKTWDIKKAKARLSRKTKLVLQFVSHCSTHSKREVYVSELKKHINVTVIGKCGRRGCNKKCEQQALDDHLFYLAFENSVCRDYVTEKLFKKLGDFVPIVLRRSTYDGILPSSSFIAADDYNSPQQLAEHLKFLHHNRTELMRYFEWMDYYKQGRTGSCNLCQFLHNKPSKPMIIPSIKQWWFGKGDCDADFVAKLLHPYRLTAHTATSTSKNIFA